MTSYNFIGVPSLLAGNFYKKIFTITAFFGKIAPVSTVVLYVSIAWLISLSYEAIKTDIDHCKEINNGKIRSWKRNLLLADEIVDEISLCFGLIIFIAITFIFIDSVTHAYYVSNNILMTSWTDFSVAVSYTLAKFFYFWMLVYTSSQISRNVQ